MTRNVPNFFRAPIDKGVHVALVPAHRIISNSIILYPSMAFSKLDRKAGIEKRVYLAFLSPEKKSLMGENHESGLTRLKTH